MSFCDQILATTQTPKLLYLSGNDYDGELYTTTKLIVRCILSKSVNSVHIKPAHHESLLFFFCFLEYQDYIYIICKNHIIWARRTRSTGDGSWLHFQTRLPVYTVCVYCSGPWSFCNSDLQPILTSKYLKLVKWVLLFQRKETIFFSMTLSFTHLYPSRNLLFLQITSEGQLARYE